MHPVQGAAIDGRRTAAINHEMFYETCDVYRPALFQHLVGCVCWSLIPI
jgi:hypothetical protein